MLPGGNESVQNITHRWTLTSSKHPELAAGEENPFEPAKYPGMGKAEPESSGRPQCNVKSNVKHRKDSKHTFQTGCEQINNLSVVDAPISLNEEKRHSFVILPHCLPRTQWGRNI